MTYDSTGNYTNVYTDANGCDSLVTLDLVINGSSETIPVTVCNSYVWDGMTYDSTGNYTNFYTDANSCDSVVTLDLTINTASATIDTLVGGDLIASGGSSYLWNTGNVTLTITPDTNGIYVVVATDSNGCADSASFNVTYITSTGILDNSISTISLYPNPINDMLNISSTDNIKSLEIKDLLGRVVYSISEINSTYISVNTSIFSNNIYIVSCLINDKLIVNKIIVSH